MHKNMRKERILHKEIKLIMLQYNEVEIKSKTVEVRRWKQTQFNGKWRKPKMMMMITIIIMTIVITMAVWSAQRSSPRLVVEEVKEDVSKSITLLTAFCFLAVQYPIQTNRSIFCKYIPKCCIKCYLDCKVPHGTTSKAYDSQ